MAEAMAATIVARGRAGFPGRAAIDSREVGGGELFFALSGEREDGGAYAGAALASGAWGIVVTPEWAGRLDPGEVGSWVFATPDPLRALQMLARLWRRSVGAKVVGITGSVGKTSVKDMSKAMLPGRVHASEENLNTEIGLPLTVLSAPADTEYLVLEMAMRGRGQIAELAAIAEPEVGVITNVGPVHVELLGSVEAIAEAKAELIAGLGTDGVLVAPVEAGPLEQHLASAPRVIRFGPAGEIAVEQSRVEGEGISATVKTPAGSREFRFPFSEAHNLSNALAAIGAGLAAGASLEDLSAGAGGITLSRYRGERIDLGERGLIINDCYNANPISMRAALEHLAGLEGNRIAVLGVMAELGPEQDHFHAEIGDHARRLGIDTVVGVGPVAREYRPDRWAGDTAEAAETVEALLSPDAKVLVKGSRSAGLEAVTARLAAAFGPDGNDPDGNDPDAEDPERDTVA